MLKANFKKIGQTDNFAGWLKKFKEIDNSLLIEVDTNKKEFIARSFMSDHGLIRRSEISFENSGFELTKLDKMDKGLMPIKTGVFMILDKFISVINTFSETDFSMTIEFDYNEETSVYQAVGVEFKSKTLKMHVDCGNLTEFTEITEDQFKTQYFVENPITGIITADVVKNLLAISSMLSVDNKNDSVKFYTKKSKKGVDLYACDGKTNAYDYFLCNIENCDIETSLTVYVSKFVTATKYNSENMKIIISSSVNDRMLIESESGETKTVIAVVI